MQLILSDLTFDNRPVLLRTEDEYESLLNANHLLCPGLLSQEEMEAALIMWVKLLYASNSQYTSDAVLPYFIDVPLDTPSYADITNEDIFTRLMESDRVSDKTKDIIDSIVLEYDMRTM